MRKHFSYFVWFHLQFICFVNNFYLFLCILCFALPCFHFMRILISSSTSIWFSALLLLLLLLPVIPINTDFFHKIPFPIFHPVDLFNFKWTTWPYSSFTSFHFSYVTMGINLGNLAALRTFRVLRALKTVAIVPGIYTYIYIYIYIM